MNDILAHFRQIATRVARDAANEDGERPAMTRVERVALLGRARDVEDGTLGAGGAFFGTNTARDGDGDDDGARERARERGGARRGRGTIAVGAMCVAIGVAIGSVTTSTREGGRTTGDVASVGANAPSGATSRAARGAEEANLGDATSLAIASVPADSWMSFSTGKVRKRKYPDSFYYVVAPEADEEVGYLGAPSDWPTGDRVTVDLHTGCSPIDALPFQRPGFDFDTVQARFVSKKLSMEFMFEDSQPMTKVGCGHFRATVELSKGWEFGFYLHANGDDSDENTMLDIGCETAVPGANNTKCPDFASPAMLATSECTDKFVCNHGLYTFWNRRYDGEQTSFLWGACGSECPHQDCGHMYCAANERVQNQACASCPPGTTNDAGDKNVGADTQCDPVICGAHMRVQDHNCVQCVAGKENEAGDDASQSNTECDAVICEPNHHVAGNVCTACPAGHAHAGGDVQHGPDTSCDEVLCHTNERVQDHQCVACPPGSTNAAGDGVASGNTQCDSTICGANRYVSNHVCVLCPYQHYRAAGDDATGPDTACIRYYGLG